MLHVERNTQKVEKFPFFDTQYLEVLEENSTTFLFLSVTKCSDTNELYQHI